MDPAETYTALYRNGQRIAGSTYAGLLAAEVPAGVATYRLETPADRTGGSDLSTKVSVAWTFRSDTARPDGDPLPLWAVRFAPAVDVYNTVRREPVTVLPVIFEHQRSSATGTLRKVTVKLSGDDGASWRNARLVSTGKNRFLAVLETPADADYISVRATATDSRENSVDQTVLRAYRLAR